MIAVTGATGFLGKRLTEYYLERGQKILCINRRKDVYKPYILLDLSKDSLHPIIPIKPKVIVHCAAAIPNHATGISDELSYELTKKIDATIFYYCKNHNVPVIYISSLGVSTFQSIIHKNDKTYFKAKLEGERLFSGINASILRVSVPVGRNMLSTNIIHTFLKQAFYQELIHVWGDGSRQQNFIDLNDVCNLIYDMTSAKHLIPGIFNVCSNQNLNMEQLSRLIQEQVGPVGRSFSKTDDPGAEFIPTTNNIRTQEIWNWSPNPSSYSVVYQVVKELINEYYQNKS